MVNFTDYDSKEPLDAKFYLANDLSLSDGTESHGSDSSDDEDSLPDIAMSDDLLITHASRPKCQRCGARPGRRIQCTDCNKMIGPGCAEGCMLQEDPCRC